jgi:hypothetical protein
MSVRLKRGIAVGLAVLAAGPLAACGTGSRQPARPPLSLPAADTFHAGTCRRAAGAILALGGFSYAHDGAKRLTDADRAELSTQGNQLAPLRDSAEPPVAQRLGAVLTAIGFVRIRTGPTYDPSLLRDLEAARTSLQAACTD